jgi:Asp-tRNA(Asn)/Glu-tRNA(Gln) amidotransferase A subunit family amidase
MEGVLPFARSEDTLGLYTHTAADMIALWKALGHPEGSEEQFSFGAPEPIPECEPEMAKAFRQSISLLRHAGVSIKTIDISGMLKKLEAANDLITTYEGARFHEARLKEFGDRLDQPVATVVREGLKISAQRYDEATKFVSDSRVRMAEIFKSTSVILTPAATGPAPFGLATTGDPAMNAPWTALGTPAISIPMPVGNGLPLGLQMTADLGQESRLLHAAIQLQTRFKAGPKISPV